MTVVTAKNKNSDLNISTRFIVDKQNNKITIDEHCEKLDPLMMRLLVHFIEHPDQLISRQELANHVWERSYTSDEAINSGISRIRKLLKGKRNDFIQTIPKQGYVFTIPTHVDIKLTTIQSTQKTTQISSTNNIEQSDNQACADNPLIPANIQQQTNSSQQAPPTAINRLKAKKTHYSILMVLAIVMVMLITLPTTSSVDEQSKHQASQQLTEPQNSNKTKTKDENTIRVFIAPFDYQSGQSAFAQTVYQLVNNKINAESALTVIHQLTGQVARPYYRLDVTLFENPKTARVQLQSHDRQYKHINNLNFNQNHEQTNPADVANEIAALIRIQLVHRQRNHRDLKALSFASYAELETIIEARQYLLGHDSQSLNYAYQQILALKEKYPNNDIILGLLALINRHRSNHVDTDVVKEKSEELKHALKALSIKPSNYDGINVAYMRHLDFAHLRKKAATYANALSLHYPNTARAWRNQLNLLIKTRKSCKTIDKFVKTIPEGVFAAYRIDVINQILNICFENKPANTLFEQMFVLPNNNINRAIINNTILFNIRDDNKEQALDKFNMKSISVAYDMHNLKNALIKEDHIGALNNLENLISVTSSYWLWRIQLYAHLHPLPQLQSHHILEEDHWNSNFIPYLENDTEWYFAASLIKNLQQNPDDASANAKLEQYLQQRYIFPINIMNRKESIAKIILLHQAGQIDEAKVIANLLYKQLNQNYQQSPNSFKFWHLCRFHLITKLYCGQSCNDDSYSPQQYLAQFFSDHHLWWLDNYELMEQSLQPFNDNPLSRLFIQKIDNDRVRMQQTIGLRVNKSDE